MFSKETEYAIRSLVYIHHRNLEEERPGVSEIAREIDAPPFFTAKILQSMVRHGFIRSMKGRGGGFYFDMERPDLPLIDLVIATGSGNILTGCVFGLKNCDSENPCPMHDQFSSIRNSINSLVSLETVQSVSKKYSKQILQ